MASPLPSRRQHEMLRVVEALEIRNGSHATIRDVAKELAVSTSTAYEMLVILTRKGYLLHTDGKGFRMLARKTISLDMALSVVRSHLQDPAQADLRDRLVDGLKDAASIWETQGP